MAQADDPKERHNLPSLGGASRPARSGAEPRLGGEAALPYLVEALGGEETHERWRAAQALGEIGERATADLVAALGDPRDNVRKAASAALYAIGAGGLPALLDALPGANLPTRREIVRLLGMIAAREADEQVRAAVLSALAGVLADPEAGVRGQAVEALGWLGDPSTVPALLDMLADDDPAVSRLAILALEAVERGGEDADGADDGDPPAL